MFRWNKVRTMKQLLTCWVCCGLAVTGCAQPPEATSAQAVRAECPPATSDTYFFPTVDSGSFNRSYHLTSSRILAAMRAPTLSCGQEQFSEVYRLIGVPGSDRPIAVSATLQNSAWSVRGVEFQHLNDLTPTIDRTRMLSNNEAVTLAQAIRESKFWMTSGLEVGPPNIVVLDGGTWILEARRNRSYHIVSGPWTQEEPFRTLGEMLISLGGLPSSLPRGYTPGNRLPPTPPGNP